MKHNVYLSQISTQYGESLFLPYSVGLLQAYAQSIPALRDAYAFKGFLVGRSRIPTVVSRMEDPAVLGLSCYVWNWEYSKALAHAVKQAYPDCLIVMGGPQVPDKSEGFFAEHPYVDVLVHGEGEITFAEILTTWRQLRRIHPPQNASHWFREISGISYAQWWDIPKAPMDRRYATIKTPPRERLKDLAQLPSPYLTGVFDELLQYQYDWVVTSESNRGCPFSCTMCDWGSATLSKVYAFDDERINAEFEWFGQHKIRYLYSADANFGILARDLALTEALVETKHTYGFPQEFRACSAKNSGERVFAIAERLHAAGMHKGATMSMQSMDAHTLQTIHRANIKTDDFAHWMRRYREAGIATYTELILGLPGETYDSFTAGIDTLLEAGQHEHLSIYLLQCLPNSELSDPAYRARHGLQTVRTPLLLQHSTVTTEALQEQEEIVIATNTMPLADWKRTYLFAWAVQTFHCLGLTRCVAMYLHEAYGVAYSRFYEGLVEWARLHPETAIGEQYTVTEAIIERALAGGSWGVVLPEVGPIMWPTEEASFLALIHAATTTYGDLYAFMDSLLPEIVNVPLKSGILIADDAFWNDLFLYQENMVVQPTDVGSYFISLHHNWHAWLQAYAAGTSLPLACGDYTLEVTPEVPYAGDFSRYAREHVWFGRKGGRALHRQVTERVGKPPIEPIDFDF